MKRPRTKWAVTLLTMVRRWLRRSHAPVPSSPRRLWPSRGHRADTGTGLCMLTLARASRNERLARLIERTLDEMMRPIAIGYPADEHGEKNTMP